MDSIDRAIEKRQHISARNDWNEQTWKAFEKEAEKKKVFLFGVGAGAGYYFDRYQKEVKLDGAIDNDGWKYGFYVDEIIPEAFGIKNSKVKISDICFLNEFNSDEIVVLITSINFYEQIAEQLEHMGRYSYYMLLMMEANRREQLSEKKVSKKESVVLKEEFAEKCCKEEKIEDKKIFFRAFADYADHGKYITEALLTMREDLDIVWSVSSLGTEVPQGVRKVYEGNWKKLIYEMETARIWVLDLEVPKYIIKRQEQLYLQTKHWASITLKKFYLDLPAFQDEPELISMWTREKQLIDHIITGSNFDTESCRRGFEFEGEVLQYGSPRSDALFHEEENKKKVYEYYKIDRKSHLLLYAPTYRFDKKRGKKYAIQLSIELDFAMLKKTLEKYLDGRWYILVRLHPAVARAFEKTEKPDFD